jgi:DNA-binding transcriptional LysR family regulator
MEFRSLRYFVAAAETGSFSRAAESSGVVQSAISHQIRALEDEVGAALFLRDGRSIRLTEVGAVLLEDARRILDMVKRSKDRIRQIAHGEIGRLRIGFQSATCRQHVVSESFHRLRARCPMVELTILPMTGLAMEEALRNGEIDGGFFYFAGAPGLASRCLYVDNWVLAVPRTHLLAGFGSLKLRNLAAEDFIWLPRSVNPLLYDRMFAACAKAGLTPRIVQEAFDEPMVLNLVSVGLGIAFVLASIPWEPDGNVAVKPVADFDVPTELRVVWNPDNANPALGRFLAIVDELCPAEPTPAVPIGSLPGRSA